MVVQDAQKKSGRYVNDFEEAAINLSFHLETPRFTKFDKDLKKITIEIYNWPQKIDKFTQLEKENSGISQSAIIIILKRPD